MPKQFRTGEKKKSGSKKKNNDKETVIKVSTKALKSVRIPSLGFVDRIKQFLREVKVELKKVTWPSKRELIGSTVVTIIFVFLVAIYLGVIDFAYTTIIGKLLG